MDNRANFIYRQPILTEVWPDYDACYYACPIDIKNFFRNLNCQIVSCQKLDSVKNKKSIFQKIGSLLLPEWMGIIRIVVKK